MSFGYGGEGAPEPRIFFSGVMALFFCIYLLGAELDIITNFPYTCLTPTKRDIFYICYGHCHITMPKSK